MDTDIMEECDYSGLPRFACAHCTGDEDPTIDHPDPEAEGYEVTKTFDARFAGRCAVDEDHKIRKGDLVGFLRLASNPLRPVQGVACGACVRVLPRA